MRIIDTSPLTIEVNEREGERLTYLARGSDTDELHIDYICRERPNTCRDIPHWTTNDVIVRRVMDGGYSETRIDVGPRVFNQAMLEEEFRGVVRIAYDGVSSPGYTSVAYATALNATRATTRPSDSPNVCDLTDAKLKENEVKVCNLGHIHTKSNPTTKPKSLISKLDRYWGITKEGEIEFEFTNGTFRYDQAFNSIPVTSGFNLSPGITMNVDNQTLSNTSSRQARIIRNPDGTLRLETRDEPIIVGDGIALYSTTHTNQTNTINNNE